MRPDEEAVERILPPLPERYLDAASHLGRPDHTLNGLGDGQQPSLVLAVGVDGDSQLAVEADVEPGPVQADHEPDQVVDRELQPVGCLQPHADPAQAARPEAGDDFIDEGSLFIGGRPVRSRSQYR